MATTLSNTVASVEQVTTNGPDGAQVGSSATELVGFWGKTPTSQRSGAAQATLTLTGTTLSSTVGFQSTAQISALMGLVVEMRAVLVDAGLMKGGA